MSPIEAKEYGIIDHIIGGEEAVFKVKGSNKRFPAIKVRGPRARGGATRPQRRPAPVGAAAGQSAPWGARKHGCRLPNPALPLTPPPPHPRRRR
jgi:hypothetical protein